jgi:hypothetical protein
LRFKASKTQSLLQVTSFNTLIAFSCNKLHDLLYAICAAMKGYPFATNSSIIFGLDSFYNSKMAVVSEQTKPKRRNIFIPSKHQEEEKLFMLN